MQNITIEILFPTHAISGLRGLRGEQWQDLIDRVSPCDPLMVDKLAFIHMMVKLGDCMKCQADSFRAMRGCPQCSSLTIKRYKGSDQDLLNLYDISVGEVGSYLKRISK